MQNYRYLYGMWERVNEFQMNTAQNVGVCESSEGVLLLVLKMAK